MEASLEVEVTQIERGLHDHLQRAEMSSVRSRGPGGAPGREVPPAKGAREERENVPGSSARKAPVPEQQPREASLEVEVTQIERGPRNHLPESRDIIGQVRSAGGAPVREVPPVEETPRISPKRAQAPALAPAPRRDTSLDFVEVVEPHR